MATIAVAPQTASDKSPVKIPDHIFREYDIRGIAGSDLTAPFAELLGTAYAEYLKKSQKGGPKQELTVSVGWDCRLTGPEYSSALIQGLRKAGLKVIQLQVCPTPLTYFSVFHLELDGGIMVTGSHNPSEYNGFKICVGKDTLHGQEIQELKKLMISLRDQETSASLAPTETFPIIPKYINYVLEHRRPTQRKKIVIDAGNGTAASVAPELFRKLGAEVVPLYCELDGRFPNHHPDPTVPANLKSLVETVLKEKADFGLAFDGDADRLGVVDEKGRILFGDEIMILFSRSILKEKPGATIISEVKSSTRLYQDIAQRGGNPVMWKTGHSLIKQKMKETRAALAGEMSGHLFFADRYFGYDDAVYAATRLYEIASEANGPLSSLLADLPKMVATPEIRIDCPDDRKFNLINEARKFLKGDFGLVDIDGIRIDFKDGWGLVRASNTQPVLVLRFEAISENRMKEIQTLMVKALRQAAQSLSYHDMEIQV